MGIKTHSTLTIHFRSSHCIDDLICRIDDIFDHYEWGEENVSCDEKEGSYIFYSLEKSRSLFKDEKENLNSDNRPRGTRYLMTKGDLFQHRLNKAKQEIEDEAKMLDP